MNRRGFIALAVGAAALLSRGWAQESGRGYRMAYLGPSPATSPPQRAFLEALGKLGFVEGQNLVLDRRGYAKRPGEFAEAAAELAQAKLDLIVCGGPEAGRAAQQATKTIPILVNTDDMVGEGLVGSMAHPGGNTTGVSILSPSLDGKRLELLLELIPNTRRVDALAGADTANPEHFEELRAAARGRGVELAIRTAQTYGEIAPAIEAAKSSGAAGLNVLGSALLFGNRQAIIERTAAVGLPAIYQWPENAHEGGLIGYGPSLVAIYATQLARLAAEILRGAKPGDLPIEQPTRFELVINLKTAKALGLTVPPSLLARADEVIE